MTASGRENTVSPPVTDKGFTLVEVMVALTLLSLILLATVTGLRTLANTQIAIERQTSRVDEVRSVSSFLRDIMESALIGGESGGLSLGGSSPGSSYFEMSSEALVWKATVQFGENFGGAYLVRVAKEDDVLVLRWQEEPVGRKMIEWNEAQQRILVENMEEFEVSWRGHYRDEWSLEWRKGDEANWVRVAVKASGRHWPELIMQVPH